MGAVTRYSKQPAGLVRHGAAIACAVAAYAAAPAGPFAAPAVVDAASFLTPF